MIIAERKPFDEIYGIARRHRGLLILGCGSCVTVCMAGGEKEVAILASQLALTARRHGDQMAIEELTIVRQCDREFFEGPAAQKIGQVDAVISLACGVGAQFCGELFPDAVVYPGLNTVFYGTGLEPGVWAERCAGCGECILEKTAGICPIARCAKNLLNGPCGGSQDGKCEVNRELECAWQLIYERMKKRGRIEELASVIEPKDWAREKGNGPRKLIREDLRFP